MKLAQSLEYIPGVVRLTGNVQYPAGVTLISFLNGIHSNFLNAFFLRPKKKLRFNFIALVIHNPIFFSLPIL